MPDGGTEITQGDGRRPTQNDSILSLLADGNWHTTRQILTHVPCIVHSRIAEINKRATRNNLGYTIEHYGAGGGAENHEYRLVGTPGVGEPRGDGLSASDTTSDEPRGAAAVSSPTPDAPTKHSTAPSPADGDDGTAGASDSYEQLTLVAA